MLSPAAGSEWEGGSRLWRNPAWRWRGRKGSGRGAPRRLELGYAGEVWGQSVWESRESTLQLEGGEEENTKGRRSRQGDDGRRFRA